MPRRLAIPAIVFFALLSLRLASQEPGPAPRIVTTPDRERIYTVQVFKDGNLVGEVGADWDYELDNVLESVALRWCMPPREYEVTPEGWRGAAKARPRIEVAIWDSQRERWKHPGGKVMPETWKGDLPLKIRTTVGSYGIE